MRKGIILRYYYILIIEIITIIKIFQNYITEYNIYLIIIINFKFKHNLSLKKVFKIL